tara:strand:- start:1510 stop:1890 length:381 start_codon:yes stop_codon:yes gene_type:complete
MALTSGNLMVEHGDFESLLTRKSTILNLYEEPNTMFLMFSEGNMIHQKIHRHAIKPGYEFIRQYGLSIWNPEEGEYMIEETDDLEKARKWIIDALEKYPNPVGVHYSLPYEGINQYGYDGFMVPTI